MSVLSDWVSGSELFSFTEVETMEGGGRRGNDDLLYQWANDMQVIW